MICKRDLSKQTGNYLFKKSPQCHKIGNFWSRFPNMEHWDRCIPCKESESMEYITVACPNSLAVDIVWNLAKHLWLKREVSWPAICFGTILDCVLADFKTDNGKKNCVVKVSPIGNPRDRICVPCTEAALRESHQIRRRSKQVPLTRWDSQQMDSIN